MIPHVVELHRVTVDVHALFAAAPHQHGMKRNETMKLQKTMPPAAARRFCSLYAEINTAAANLPEDAVLQDLEQEPRRGLEQYHLPPPLFLLPTKLAPPAPLGPTGFSRESNGLEDS
jgi:hypothetical protein